MTDRITVATIRCPECDGDGGHVGGWDSDSYYGERCDVCRGTGRAEGAECGEAECDDLVPATSACCIYGHFKEDNDDSSGYPKDALLNRPLLGGDTEDRTERFTSVRNHGGTFKGIRKEV